MGSAHRRARGRAWSSCLAAPSQLCFLVPACAVSGRPFRGLVHVMCFPYHVYAGVSLSAATGPGTAVPSRVPEPKRLLVPTGETVSRKLPGAESRRCGGSAVSVSRPCASHAPPSQTETHINNILYSPADENVVTRAWQQPCPVFVQGATAWLSLTQQLY